MSASSVGICVGDGAEIVSDANGYAMCDGGTWQAVPQFDAAQLDVTAAGAAFAGGFVLVATATLLGRAVRVLLDMLK